MIKTIETLNERFVPSGRILEGPVTTRNPETDGPNKVMIFYFFSGRVEAPGT